MEMNVKKRLYQGVLIVPMPLYGAQSWGTISAERRKVNVLELKCLRSLVGVSRMDIYIARNEEVNRRAGIETELASRVAYQLEWDGMPIHDAVQVNCEMMETTHINAQVPSARAKGSMLDYCACVIGLDMTTPP